MLSYLRKQLFLIKAQKDVSEGLSGETMATPSIWQYTLLFKLNSTEEVANSINSTNTFCGMGDVVNAVESSECT